jgi:lysozyme
MTTRDLQTLLARLGFDPGGIDGQWGKKTEGAVKAYQAARGLFPDGIVGPKTRAALERDGLAFAPLSVSPDCIDLIKAWEGLHDGNKQTTLLEPEMDPRGIWTLGWGHALVDQAGRFIEGRGRKADADAWMMRNFGKLAITRDEAKALLSNDVNRFLTQIAPLIRGVPVVQSEIDALVSFSYNVGAANFRTSTLRNRHAARVAVSPSINFPEARAKSQAASTSGATEYAFGAWSKMTVRGKREWVLGLWRRRMSEAMVYRGDGAARAVAVAGGLK